MLIARGHLLHRFSIGLSSLFILGNLTLKAMTFNPPLIQEIELHCLSPMDRELTKDSRVMRLLSWDISELNSNLLTLQERGEQVIEALDSEINSSFDRGQQAVFVSLQGVPFQWRQALKKLLIERGGCWAYAPLWHHHAPLFTSLLPRLYKALFGSVSQERLSTHLRDHGLWSAVIGLSRDQVLSAERWSMIPQPERWPKRLFSPKPAALVLKTSDRSLINIKLPDTTHKHQSGALSLQSLKRPPLRERLIEPWVIIGDWRVNPPMTEAHSEIGYRFQRFSLEELHKKHKALFEPKVDPNLWGRWRLNKDHSPSVIDLAFSSQGSLTPIHPLPRWDSQEPWLHWLEGAEQRALLVADWRLEN